MITIKAHIDPTTNVIEFPEDFVLPTADTYVGIYVDETHYYLFETAEEKTAFYLERGLIE